MAVSRRLRFEILRRDSHTCRYCGQRPPDVSLTIDHVIPTALGGGDEPSNLVTACSDCNVTDEILLDWDLQWDEWVGDGEPIRKDADFEESLKRFLRAGLPGEEMIRLIGVAMRSKAKPEGTWKFYCGCCWRAIADLQETARQLIESGEVE